MIAGCASSPSGVVEDDIAYDVSLTVAESFPVQLGLSVRIENVGSNPTTVTFPDGCVILMRVYDGDELVWDQGNRAACTLAIVDVDLNPGQVETFDIGLIGAGEILGDSLPDGEYRIAAYLRPDGEIELNAGTVDLAIPR